MNSKFMEGFEKFKKIYHPDEVLFREGDTGNDFYMIRTGLVDITKNIEGNKITVATTGPGEVIGEMALVDEDSSRSASAIARTEVECLKFSKKQFDNLMERSADFRQRVLSILCDRLRKTTSKLTAAEQQVSLLQPASLFLLAMIEKEKWYNAGCRQIDLNPDLQRISKMFDLEKGALRILLSTAGEDDLTEFDPQNKKIATETAGSLLEKSLDKFVIKGQPEAAVAEKKPAKKIKKLTLAQAAANAKNLYLALSNNNNPLNREQFRRIQFSYDQLNTIYQKNQENSTGNMADKGQLGAYIQGLNRIIQKKVHRQIEKFKNKKIKKPYPYLFIYTTTVKYKRIHHELKRELILPIGINPDGCPEILGFEINSAKNKTFWVKFFSSLRNRGLKELKLVISTANSGIKNTVKNIFNARWNWCQNDFIKTVAKQIPEEDRQNGQDQLLTIFNKDRLKKAQDEVESLIKWFDDKGWKKACTLLKKSAADALTYMDFPAAHWNKIGNMNQINNTGDEILGELNIDKIFPDLESLEKELGFFLPEQIEKNTAGLGSKIFIKNPIPPEPKKEDEKNKEDKSGSLPKKEKK